MNAIKGTKRINNTIYLKFTAITFISIICSFLFSKLYTVSFNKQAFIFNDVIFFRLLLSFLLFEFVFAHFILNIDKMYKFIFKYRFWISAALLGFCVIFELSGSSIGNWVQYFGDLAEGANTVYGIPRMIRSDEWAVNTPMALSQVYNMTERFPYFSDVMRGGSLTDMFIVYGQPVLNIAVLFRPFHWGYLLFGAEKGLAFFWYGRLIALFLVTFEFSRVITNDNKILSLMTAVLITFAPIVQWWFAVNGIAEILIFGQLILLLIYNYMKTESYKKRLIYALLFVIAAGGYILVFYPAWQVCAAYVWLGFFIWIVIDNYKGFKFNKKDLLILALVILLLFGGLGYIILKSKDTIKAVMGTVYPGSRCETGGGGIKFYIRYVINLFLPFKSDAIPTNECEEAVFFDLFPIGYILAFYVICIEKNKDKLLRILLIICAFLNLWILLSFSEIIAKGTLMFSVTSSRCYFAIGLINIFILIRSIVLIKEFVSKKGCLILSATISLFLTVIGKTIYSEYLTRGMSFIIFFVLGIGFYLFFISYKSVRKIPLLIYCVITVFVTGICVNPVEKGLGAVYNNELINAIREINENDSGIWVFEGLGFPMNNYPVMAGVPTLNSTNVYPDLEKWHKIDTDREYEDVYNRYAHIIVEIERENESRFYLNNADVFTLYLNALGLQKLNVKYIISVNDLETFNNGVTFNKIFEEGAFKIYKTDYTNADKYQPYENIDFNNKADFDLSVNNEIPVTYCIDSCTEIGEGLKINGWAFVENNSAENQKVFVEIKNENGEIKTFEAYKETRTDVGEAFNSKLYEKSGFKAEISLNEILNGMNEINILIQIDDNVFKSSAGYSFSK